MEFEELLRVLGEEGVKILTEGKVLISDPFYDNFTPTESTKQFVIALKEVINSFSDIPEDLKKVMSNECYWWYIYCLKYGITISLIGLRIELRSFYKLYRIDLKGFDILIQKVFDVFKTYCKDDTNHLDKTKI